MATPPRKSLRKRKACGNANKSPGTIRGIQDKNRPVPFADELSALVLKSLATRARSKDTDIADVWRCLEIALAAGLGPDDFTGGIRAESAEVIRALFSSRHGPPWKRSPLSSVFQLKQPTSAIREYEH